MPGGGRGRRGFGKGWKRRMGRGRPIIPRNVDDTPFKQFIPVIPPEMIDEANPIPIYLYDDEFEAVKLVDLDNLTQDQAGEKMQVSRGTIWRLLQVGRKKIISALVEGRQLYIVNSTPVDSP